MCVCVWQETMISFRMFTEFVKCRDLERIETVLVDRQYELDQTDDVRTYNVLVISLLVHTYTRPKITHFTFDYR